MGTERGDDADGEVRVGQLIHDADARSTGNSTGRWWDLRRFRALAPGAPSGNCEVGKIGGEAVAAGEGVAEGIGGRGVLHIDPTAATGADKAREVVPPFPQGARGARP